MDDETFRKKRDLLLAVEWEARRRIRENASKQESTAPKGFEDLYDCLLELRDEIQGGRHECSFPGDAVLLRPAVTDEQKDQQLRDLLEKARIAVLSAWTSPAEEARPLTATAAPAAASAWS